ncbi:MAG: substrate-binding domain-containing protein [Lachnospiraceae bacterium]|nr:substrate-binding domain-containing protein [Lachnospiraceae bacterium]
MTKRILMLTSTWDSDYSKAIVAGIIDRIGDDDIKLHIFNAYDDMEYEFYRKAREIYSLSDPSNFDGLLLALPTVAAVDYISSITERFHEYNKPIVGIDTHAENAIFCGLDNYRSMYQLVDHMITIHDCRNLNYLGGPEDHKENMERFSAFCDCLKDHGLRIQNKRVLHKRYRRNNGIDAYNEWKELGVNMADAVICANDFMALGYVEAAVKDGMMIPDYMKVTGFDNIIEGQTYSPSITSINRNWKSLGYESMDALIEAMNNETEFDTHFVEGSIAFNESCGCSLMRDIRSDYNEMIGRVKSENEVARRQGYVRQLLFGSSTMDEFMQELEKCKLLLNIEDTAVCLNESFFDTDADESSTGYEDRMIMYNETEKTVINRKEQMIPEKWSDQKVFLYASLRSTTRTYGYTVMPYNDEFFTRLRHRTFVESMSMALTNICQHQAIDTLNKSSR